MPGTFLQQRVVCEGIGLVLAKYVSNHLKRRAAPAPLGHSSRAAVATSGGVRQRVDAPEAAAGAAPAPQRLRQLVARCPVCGRGVFSDQGRCKDAHGTYYHKRCVHLKQAVLSAAASATAGGVVDGAI